MMSTMSNQPISSPVLIGRQREVAILQSLIDQVRQGRGQVLLLSGEAGIGKSRLLAEGKRQASEQGFLVLQGSCFPTDRSAPYAPLLDLLSASPTQELPDSQLCWRNISHTVFFAPPELGEAMVHRTKSLPAAVLPMTCSWKSA